MNKAELRRCMPPGEYDQIVEWCRATGAEVEFVDVECGGGHVEVYVVVTKLPKEMEHGPRFHHPRRA